MEFKVVKFLFLLFLFLHVILTKRTKLASAKAVEKHSSHLIKYMSTLNNTNAN